MPQRDSARFRLVLIRPSRYDDDGYVISWWRSAIPSNSLAVLSELARDCVERRVLGEHVHVELTVIDESNRPVSGSAIADLIERDGAGAVLLVGVQSNQFPRAIDIARPLRARGIPVVIGGFHVSGILAMLDGQDAGIRDALDLGVSLFGGEAEGRLEAVLQDAYAGTMKPIYNYLGEPPTIAGAPVPLLGPDEVRRNVGRITSFDAGRGCPFQCSFCTIINVQGHASRTRTPEDVERIVRTNVARGLTNFFLTDDNFARNASWEPILDRLIALRQEGFAFSLLIQVDAQCHRLPRFIDKCAAAGVKRVYIGLETINEENLASAKKRQNRLSDYRALLLAWKKVRIIAYAGFIVGFPADSAESVLRDVEVIKRELPIELLEFFYLTPLPGSEDHQRLVRSGAAIEPDLNRYNLSYATTGHPRMSKAEWERTFQDAWRRYYSFAHIETILRRTAASKARLGKAVVLITWFRGCHDIERLSPLEGGFVRRKVRRERRPGRPVEAAWRFYPAYWWDTVVKQSRWIALYFRVRLIYLRIKHGATRYTYTDEALSASEPDFGETIGRTIPVKPSASAS